MNALRRFQIPAIIAVLGAIWGCSFLMTTYALRVFEPLQVAAFRLVFAGMIMLPIALRYLGQLREGRNLPWLVVVGLFAMVIPFPLFAYAQTEINSSLAGMINAMVPTFTFILTVFVFGARGRWYHALGVLVGLLGSWFLINPSGGSSTGFLMPSLCLMATMMYAVSITLTRYRLGHLQPLQLAALPMALTLPVSLAYLGFINPPDFSAMTDQTWMALGILFVQGAINTAATMVFFNLVILRAGPLSASLSTYVAPIVATIIGYAVGEYITAYELLGLALVLGGVFMISYLDIGRQSRLDKLRARRAI